MPLTSINIYTLKQVRVSKKHYDLEDCQITCPLACFKAIQSLLDLKSAPVEQFGIISLNTKNKIAGIHVIAIGGLESAAISPREIFLAAMHNNANAIIAFHNHPAMDGRLRAKARCRKPDPSGDPEPSKGDLAMTRRLKEVGELLDIRLLDHIVTGETGYVSLKEREMI